MSTEPLLTISAFARAVELAPSTLRYYDEAGLLPPAEVDPRTGYRYYTLELERRATLIRRMRDIGVPVEAMRMVLAGPAGNAAAVLGGFAERAARSAQQTYAVVDEIVTALEGERTLPDVAVTVDGPELAAGLRKVARAASAHEVPLRGVLLDLGSGGITPVATDRYLLAYWTIPVAEVQTSDRRAFLPLDKLDEVAQRLEHHDVVTVEFGSGKVTVADETETAPIPTVDDRFPAYRLIVPGPEVRTGRVTFDRTSLCRLLSGPDDAADDTPVRLAVGNDRLGVNTLGESESTRLERGHVGQRDDAVVRRRCAPQGARHHGRLGGVPRVLGTGPCGPAQPRRTEPPRCPADAEPTAVVTAADAGAAPASETTTLLLRGGFVAWLVAATVSSIGDGIFFFALAWTASGLGAHTVTLVLTAGLLPPLLLTLVGGTAADRWGLRRTIIGCNLATCVLFTAYLLVAQVLPVTGVLLALALAEGVVNAFHRPANAAFPRLFFPDPLVPRAMSLTGSAMEVARIAGPPLGAVLVVAVSMNGAILADLVSFGVVLVVLVAVRPPYEPTRIPVAAGSAVGELRAGLRAVRGVPGVGAMLVAAGIVAGSVIPMLSLCVPLLARSRGWGARDAGLMEAFWIVGALGVSLLVARVGIRARPVGPLSAGPVLASVGIALAVAAPAPMVAFAAAGVMGVGTAVFTSHLFPLYLLQTPDGMLARFQSVLIVAQMLAMFVGNAWLGGLASRFGPEPAMLAAALACACAAAPVLGSPALRRARTR